MAYSTTDLNDTIIALATPPGVGAIGVIRLSGKEAIRIVNEVFPSKDLTKQSSHTIHLGTIREEGRILDELLVSLFKGPRSYTGENVVELSCHGSQYIIQELMQLLLKRGARMAQPGEFTMRAFLNGKLDLSQAEAVADLISSSSSASHQMAISQMRGGFSDQIKALRQELLDFASLIELELDFSEEDVEFADRTKLRHLVEKIQKLIKALLDSFMLGNVIKQGVQTVIAGRPNAGKSTLLNALLNEDRAIVSNIAGTTRDTIEESLNIKGIQFRLVDTAGIRDAEDTIEAIGVEKTMEKIAQSSLLVYVFDVIESGPEQVQSDLERLLKGNMNLLVVANKMDLNPHTKYEHYASDLLPASSFVPISAKEKMNVDFLKDKLYKAVLDSSVSLDQTVVSNARHFDSLQKSFESLQEVLAGLDSGISSDFVAMDIRRALGFLGEITGEISTDELLGNIFGRFCIGK